eukprot:TRINITY_DN13181_c0_g1_i2.p1 TRINITY_DN13181_c0_g1~~TRINITY_DN13181_c0_g1_i2.p1  ORF type:complete len:100 (-),score=5.21 TRINITY_DN13181_c0_g1_i2:36-335(-)
MLLKSIKTSTIEIQRHYNEPTNKSECWFCLRKVVCVWQFRKNNEDSFMDVCSFCRNRVVASCNLYVFLKDLKLHFRSSNAEEQYDNLLKLRLKLFLHRL